MAKVVFTLAIYRDKSAYESNDYVMRHYLVEFSDVLVNLQCDPLYEFAMQAAISYAFDEYYFNEGWTDVIVRYSNNRILSDTDTYCKVSPCSSVGHHLPFFGSKKYSNRAHRNSHINKNKNNGKNK